MKTCPGIIKRTSNSGLLLSLLVLGFALDAISQTNRMPEIRFEPGPIERKPGVNSFAPIVSNVVPSVVSIYTRRTVRNRMMHPLMQDPMLRRFFGMDGEDPQLEPRQEQGLGSGVLISKDGYTLSNSHVVEGADEITVVTSTGREFSARVVGTDPPTDIAVLKIEGENLPFATLTDNSNLRVGDVVLAIGNPFGVGQTVTAGIVSATERTGFGITEYEDFIQTDASINPGNSGGALIDSEGRVVGINTAILTRTGGSQGVSFAVPINLARLVMEQIIQKGKVIRGYLGVYIQQLTPELAKSFNVPEGKGVLVGGVTPDSPAAEAGVKEGDVIVEFNDKPVANTRDLRFRASQTPPETRVRMAIVREGQKRDLSVTLGELPNEEMAASGPGALKQTPETTGVLQGVTLQNLTQEFRQRLNIPERVQGPLVTMVAPGSPGQRAGLREGDIILEVEHRRVTSTRDVTRALRNAEGQVLLRIWSQGSMRYLVLEQK